jgi:hypothetical protein
MSDYQNEDLTGLADVYEAYPILQSFPFGGYNIALEQEEDDGANLGIDPVIISESGGIAPPEFVNFYYMGKYTNIALSFYTYDINFIRDNAHKIKKLDSLRELLDTGLESDDSLIKISSIKKGERFLKKIGSSLNVGKSFDQILDQLLVEGTHVVTSAQIKKIKGKSPTLDVTEFSEDIQIIINSFYNIHLHHIKILLGVVIAAKIH